MADKPTPSMFPSNENTTFGPVSGLDGRGWPSNYDYLILQLLAVSKSVPEKVVLLEPLFESGPVLNTTHLVIHFGVVSLIGFSYSL